MPLPVDDYRRSQAIYLEKLYQPAQLIGRPSYVGGACTLPERLPVLKRAVRSGVNGHDGNAAVTKLILNPTQGRSLQPAGGSTWEGKVQYHHLAGVFVQREGGPFPGAN